MANYARTGPFNNNAIPSISAAFLNAIENVLEQPSGGSETGKYFLLGQGYANATYMGTYMVSLSRTSTPVSVTKDAADQAAVNTAGSTTSNLTSNGFLVYCQANSISTIVQIGGNTTINY